MSSAPFPFNFSLWSPPLSVQLSREAWEEGQRKSLVALIGLAKELFSSADAQKQTRLLLNDVLCALAVSIFWVQQYAKALDHALQAQANFETLLSKQTKNLPVQLGWKKSVRSLALSCLGNVCQMCLSQKPQDLSCSIPRVILKDSTFRSWSPWFLFHQFYFFFYAKREEDCLDCLNKLIYLHKLAFFPHWLSESRSYRRKFQRKKGRRSPRALQSTIVYNLAEYDTLGPLEASSISKPLVQFLQIFPFSLRTLEFLFEFLPLDLDKQEPFQRQFAKIYRFHTYQLK